MVKGIKVEKASKDVSTLITVFGFWSVQLALIIGKLSGASISWWGVASPTLIVLGLVFLMSLFSVGGRSQW